MRIDTPVGPLRVRARDGMVFAGGVPYARAARWRAPEPVRWTEPLDATRPGPAPPQTRGALALVPGTSPARQAEDCLTAELWTRSLDGRAPVLLWVPGGSYRVGAASLPTYDGTRLASEGVVVVACNYRLGALGWLAADGVPTNLGLRDLAAALAWVRAVVPAFGGDPARVVLFGESAGAGAIAHLLSTPGLSTPGSSTPGSSTPGSSTPGSSTPGPAPAAGAILQSGAPAATLDAAQAEWVARQVFDAAGVDGVRGLRRAPLEVGLAAQERAVEASLAKVGMMPFHPFVDGDLLTAAPFAAPLAPIPLVVGTTASEMELFRDQVPSLPDDVAVRFLARKAAAVGVTDESAARAGLRACGGDLVDAVADLDLHLPTELLARGHESRGNRVWRSRFDWQAPRLGACHALDLPFHFGTLDVDGWRDFAGAHDPGADALSRRMRQAWRAFSTFGQPSDAVIGPWPTGQLVHLGPDARVGPDAIEQRLAVWLGEAAPA